jgi:hypothetical protein
MMSIAPPDPSETTTTVCDAWPGVGLRFDVPEYSVPAGKTAMNVEFVTSVAVRLNTTAVAVSGIPLFPATVHTSVS